MWHSRPPRDPPPFMANAILNFHFDYLNPSLNCKHYQYIDIFYAEMQTFDNIFGAKARNKLTIFWTKLHTLALVLALLLTSDKCLSSLPPLPDLLSINMRNKKPLHIYIRDCNFSL